MSRVLIKKWREQADAAIAKGAELKKLNIKDPDEAMETIHRIVAIWSSAATYAECADELEQRMNLPMREIASILGRSGGLAKSKAKTRWARKNGLKGGRPRKNKK